MSIHNEDEFKIQQNGKNYSVIIGIEEDQLSLILILYSNPPRQYSGFFSLNELRISSKIFNHTKTLFEAKEIIKRTVIKKQLLIDENDLRVNVTFDVGLGHDSVPFPITLFRDATQRQNNNAPLNNIGNPRDNTKKSKIIKNGNNNIINNNNNYNNNMKKNNNMNMMYNYNNMNNNNNIQENNYDKQSNNTINTANTALLRASIGNNVNNKMLNQNQTIIRDNNNQIDSISMGNIQFNNSRKKLNNNNGGINLNGNNFNNDINSQKSNFNNNPNYYKKVDFINNANIVNNNVNLDGNNKTKDYVELNNNILYNIYNNMNNNNNINSSFYRNLENSFKQNNNNQNINNNINANNNLRQNIRNIDNNSMNQPYIQQNLNNPRNNMYKNINNQPYLNINNNISNNQQNLNVNKNINNQPQYHNNLGNGQVNMNNYVNNNILNRNNIPNKNPNQNRQMQQHQNIQNVNNNINPNVNNNIINPAIIAQNLSFATAPVPANITKIPNIDNNIFLNKSINLENNKNKTFGNNNDNNILATTSSEEEDNNDDNIDDNIEDSYQGEQPYRFKNLVLKGPKKIKGNLEKFKENQNIGDYVPSGTKYVSYLKFPDTKNLTNQSITASTISSSLTSGSNRIVGIEKNIIKNPSELEEITSRIQRILRKRNIRYKLLYKASVDGDISTKFHEKCDKIPNTLVLIHASLDKRFGGFTTKTWDGDDINKKDNDCFIFSIDKMKIYDINEQQDAINCNPDLGPVFIDQIKLLDKFFIQGGSTNKRGKTFSTLEDFEITGGAQKFGVKEVEVYQVK